MIFVFLLLFSPSPLAPDVQNQFVIWNIGQGQWITAIDSKNCYHFDVGGEFFNSNKISRSCGLRNNIIFYSHWDWDHIGLTLKLKRSVKSLCIAMLPQGRAENYKMEILNRIPLCKKKISVVKKLEFNYKNSKNENELSQIFIYNKKLLIPGDSTKKMEKIWFPLISKKIKWLQVSHHGSQTSTSDCILRHSHFSQALVSARRRVYGHPHKTVMARLKKYGVPVLKTEDWGNIHVLLLKGFSP